MATCSIDIAGMRTLVTSMEKANENIPVDKGTVSSDLTRVWLSAQPVSPADNVTSWLSTEMPGLRRRLAMAIAIEASTPGVQSFVQFDESKISTKSPAEAKALAQKVVNALKDKAADDVDPEILKLLAENKVDPYFASELAKNLSIDDLDQIVANWSGYRQVLARDPYSAGEKLKDYDANYKLLLDGLGQSIGLATQQTGTDLKLPSDYTKKWLAAIANTREGGGDQPMGRPSRLAMLVAHGTFSTEFTTTITKGIVDYEKQIDLPGMWQRDGYPSLGSYIGAVEPGGKEAYDPLASLLQAVGRDPNASMQLFAHGDTTTIPVDGKDTQVNALLKYLVSDRRWPTDEGDGLKHAIAAGMTPTLGGSTDSMKVATDAKAIMSYKIKQLEDAQGEDHGWFSDIGHIVLDGLGLIPVAGEAFDAINGIWYYAEGNVIDGSLSMASCIPVLGWAAVGGKWTRKGLKAAEMAGKILTRDGKLITDVKQLSLLAKADNIEPGIFKFDNLADLNRAANNPHPGVIYQYKNMQWTTDELKRTTLVQGKLDLGAAGRDPKLQRDIGNGPNAKDTDVGFHLIADSLGGPTNKLNVLPGNGKPIDDGLANLNQGAYSSMEKSLRSALKDGKDVEFELTPIYKDATDRPAEFVVRTWVDGAPTEYHFINK